MIATLRNKNFALLWAGGLISMIGNWILIAAMPFHIYSLTGSALATSGFLIAYLIPGILFSSVAGVFVDRWDRKRTMLAASLAQSAVILALVVVQSAELVWLIYVVAFIESTLSHFFGPAENALLPRLVGEEHLVSANSMNAMNDNLGRLIGPALGGALLGVVGYSSVIVADSVSYLIAAVLISLVAAPGRKTVAGVAGRHEVGAEQPGVIGRVYCHWRWAVWRCHSFCPAGSICTGCGRGWSGGVWLDDDGAGVGRADWRPAAGPGWEQNFAEQTVDWRHVIQRLYHSLPG
jgi:MFS family permease